MGEAPVVTSPLPVVEVWAVNKWLWHYCIPQTPGCCRNAVAIGALGVGKTQQSYIGLLTYKRTSHPNNTITSLTPWHPPPTHNRAWEREHTQLILFYILRVSLLLLLLMLFVSLNRLIFLLGWLRTDDRLVRHCQQ